MPKQRPIEHFACSDEQTPVKIDETPYEVSDEELQVEADEVRLKEILAKAHSAIPVPLLSEGFILLCKKLGIG